VFWHCRERSPAALVLTRRLHQSIVLLGLNVPIRVVEVKGDRIRLGIEAPKDTPVMREEPLQDQSIWVQLERTSCIGPRTCVYPFRNGSRMVCQRMALVM
jgi:carbon storage regulator